MSLKSLMDYTFTSKYARYIEQEKRRETWSEAVTRMRDMHIRKYPNITSDIEWAFEQVLQKKVLGSQRALQFGGTPIEKNNLRIYNCAGSYCDRPRFFQEMLFILLSGCGVGFSAQKHHIDKLPEFTKARKGRNILFKKKYIIPDSIEGWADSLGVLISSYLENPVFPEYYNCEVEFDYSQIRPKGSIISSGVGKAPGPDPLSRSLELIRDLLNKCVNGGLDRLRPIDAYDIVMHASDAVLSGGVRRSATICLFSPDDQEMVTAKTGDWQINNPQRARSNNSAMLIRGETTKDQFLSLFESVRQYGEPGFFWSDDREFITQPCVEIGFYSVDTETGLSGWQMCVAGDTNLITRTSIEQIKNVIGKEIEIWNGNEWSTVIPFKTGSNRTLYRVLLSDGSWLDCTSNHKWVINEENDELEKTTIELKPGDCIPRSKINPNSIIGKDVKDAYEYGFVLGDGTSRGNNRSPIAKLFKNDQKLKLNAKLSPERIGKYKQYETSSKWATFQTLERELVTQLKHNDDIPNEIFSWSYKSISDFIGGWVDADGSQANHGCRLYGSEGRIRKAQLLLTKIGVNSSVNLMQKAGTKTNFGIRTYDIWYLQIPNASNINSRRLSLKDGREPIGKGRVQRIISIIKLSGKYDTYCLTELKQNKCVFNNVLTKQCNLSTINGKKVKSKEDFLTAAKAASIIGTLQAGYTDFSYLGETSEKITRREALLGVSITGVMDNPEILLDGKCQRNAAKIVKEVNKEIAEKIGINQSARTTCLKPEGTSSCLLGSSSGIHPHHARRYFRRQQANSMEEPLAFYKKYNPRAVDKSVWSRNNTDEIITFCVEVEEGARLKNQASAIELLENVKNTRKNWVETGKNPELCTKPWLSHNVSNTITVMPDEWDDVAAYIYKNRDFFAGISLLPASGDLDYPQAPFVAVHTPREILANYGDGCLFASGLIVQAQDAFGDLWIACDLANDLRRDMELNLQQEQWLIAAQQFTKRYFQSDCRKMTYCLKDVHNWKLWLDLNREYVEVDFSKMSEEDNNTNFNIEPACAGGVCEI